MNENEKYLFASQMIELLDKFHLERTSLSANLKEMEVKKTCLELENEMLSESLEKYFQWYLESNGRAKATLREIRRMIGAGELSLRAGQLLSALLVPSDEY